MKLWLDRLLGVLLGAIIVLLFALYLDRTAHAAPFHHKVCEEQRFTPAQCDELNRWVDFYLKLGLIKGRREGHKEGFREGIEATQAYLGAGNAPSTSVRSPAADRILQESFQLQRDETLRRNISDDQRWERLRAEPIAPIITVD